MSCVTAETLTDQWPWVQCICQIMHPLNGEDVSIWIKNSRMGRKTNKHKRNVTFLEVIKTCNFLVIQIPITFFLTEPNIYKYSTRTVMKSNVTFWYIKFQIFNHNKVISIHNTKIQLQSMHCSLTSLTYNELVKLYIGFGYRKLTY